MDHMNSEDTALKALLELLNALEAGVASARQIIREDVSDWDPEKIKWQETAGPSGPFQKSDDVNNPEFKVMLKDLQAHKGKMTKNGWFYWVFKNGATVGRKRLGSA
jgi:hypothetical protein